MVLIGDPTNGNDDDASTTAEHSVLKKKWRSQRKLLVSKINIEEGKRERRRSREKGKKERPKERKDVPLQTAILQPLQNFTHTNIPLHYSNRFRHLHVPFRERERLFAGSMVFKELDDGLTGDARKDNTVIEGHGREFEVYME